MGSDEIRYIYLADGTKLAQNASGSLTYYNTVMVYGVTGTTLQLNYMMQPEGLIVPEGSAYVYKYFKTDHLGNTRAMLAARKNAGGAWYMSPEQTTDYYAYGMNWDGFMSLNLNKYLYGGKELQDAVVGSQNFLGLYDFEARYYNPMLGRWFNQDPAHQMANPYSYCGNSPMTYIDPDGRFVWFIPVIVAIIAGSANVAANWDHIDGFWQGFSTFAVGAAAGARACFTGGWSLGALMGYGALSGAAIAANNDIVAQTGHNFDGFNHVDWDMVAESSAYGGLAGAIGAGVGSWAAGSNMLVNGINSPLLRSMVVAPLASGTAQVVTGTLAGVVRGMPFDAAFNNSLNGIGKNMLTAAVIAGATTTATSLARGINPINGKPVRPPQIDNGARVDNLLKQMDNVGPVNKGYNQIQGFVEGDAQQIMSDITQGLTPNDQGAYTLPDGREIHYHNSTSTKIPTITVNNGRIVINIRIQK